MNVTTDDILAAIAAHLAARPAQEDDALVLGEWMKVNGTAIHGTEASPFPRKFQWGRITQGVAFRQAEIIIAGEVPSGAGRQAAQPCLADQRRERGFMRLHGAIHSTGSFKGQGASA